MSTIASWKTRDEILNTFMILKNSLDNYKTAFIRLNQIKLAVLDDPVKKADIAKLFNEDPSLSMAQVMTEYLKAKTIYDWILANT